MVPGLKTGVENDNLWSELKSGIGETGGKPPQRISRGNPPGDYFCKRTSVGSVLPLSIRERILNTHTSTSCTVPCKSRFARTAKGAITVVAFGV